MNNLKIEKLGRKAIIVMDQHPSHRSILQRYLPLKNAVILMTPKKSPWCNLSEFFVGMLKNKIRKDDAQNQSQVLLSIKQSLSSCTEVTYQGLMRQYCRENGAFSQLLKDHIEHDIYWRVQDDMRNSDIDANHLASENKAETIGEKAQN